MTEIDAARFTQDGIKISLLLAYFLVLKKKIKGL
jgi:hypothetical protein